MSNRVPFSCGDPGRLRGLLEGTLPEGEQAELEAHLERCDACRRAFDAMAAGGRFWDDLRQFAGDGTASVTSSRSGREASRPVGDHDGDGDEDEPLHFLEPVDIPGRIGRFGRYEVLDVLGRGGMGIVLKAFDPGLHRLVAIKVLSPMLATSASARRRFDREARAAASVVHEHVVTIHSVDNAGGLPYLVMQHVAGRSLQQRIDRDGPLELEAILRIGMQAAAGLAAAHAQGLVHRDVKPANILLENGIERVKLTDFGLARAVDDASLTRSGVVAGTPQYMAPEQARAETVDHRADLFSLGSVIYAMCTGRSPFRGESTAAVVRRVCDDTPRPIREVNPSIPDWLAAIVARLHAKDPAARFQSAAEVADLLGRHLARLQQPSTAAFPAPAPASAPVAPPLAAADPEFDRIPAAGKAARRGTRWRRLGWIAALAGLLIIGLILAEARLVRMFQDHLAGPQAVPRLYFYPDRSGDVAFYPDGSGDAAMKGLVRSTLAATTLVPGGVIGVDRGPVRSVAISPDGMLGLSSGGHSAGAEDAGAWLWVLGPASEWRRLGDSSLGPVLGVAFSPDGRRALTCGQAPVVRLWDVGTGREIRRLEGHPGPVDAVASSPDGRRAASAGVADALIRLWDVETGRELRRLEGHTARVASVAYSPDGRFVLSGGEDRTIRLWDAETGRELRQVPGVYFRVESVAFSSDGRLAMAGGADGIVWAWDVETGRELRRLVGHQGTVAGATFVPGTSLALTVSPDPSSSGGDGTLRFWDVDAGRELGRIVAPDGAGFCSVAAAPDGHSAITGGTDGTVRLWLLRPRVPQPVAEVPSVPADLPGEVRVLTGHTGKVRAIAATGDGRFAISGGRDPALRLWDLRTGREVRKLVGHDAEVSSVAIADDGRFAVSGGRDQTVRLWDVGSGLGAALAGRPQPIRAVAIARSGRFALSGGEERELSYWDLVGAKELRRLKGQTQGTSPHANQAAVPEAVLRQLEAGQGHTKGTLPEVVLRQVEAGQGHTKGTLSVAISPDGRLGLSGGEDGMAILWDLESGTSLRVLARDAPSVSAVAFMPDGRRALIGRQDGTLGLHDVNDGREIRRLAGHRAHVRNVQASRDGRLILSAGGGALRLWDADSGDEVYQLQGIGGDGIIGQGIACGAILPGDREVLFGCDDGTVRLWRLPHALAGRAGPN